MTVPLDDTDALQNSSGTVINHVKCHVYVATTTSRKISCTYNYFIVVYLHDILRDVVKSRYGKD